MPNSHSLLLALAGTSLIISPVLAAPPVHAQSWHQIPAATGSRQGGSLPAAASPAIDTDAALHSTSARFPQPRQVPTVTRPSAAQRRWTSPTSPIAVVEPFRPPAHDWLPGHRGIDLRTHPGDPVRAAGAGVVTYASRLAGRGVVVIDHGSLRTTYEPVEAVVEVGQRARAGERIGTVGTGSGHCGSGRCLHLGLRRGRDYLDPALILWTPLARLIPW